MFFLASAILLASRDEDDLDRLLFEAFAEEEEDAIGDYQTQHITDAETTLITMALSRFEDGVLRRHLISFSLRIEKLNTYLTVSM
jgi:hypothetical protein